MLIPIQNLIIYTCWVNLTFILIKPGNIKTNQIPGNKPIKHKNFPRSFMKKLNKLIINITKKLISTFHKVLRLYSKNKEIISFSGLIVSPRLIKQLIIKKYLPKVIITSFYYDET